MSDEHPDAPLDLRALVLPPHISRRTVTIEVGGFLCADGAAWCGELLALDAGLVDVVTATGNRRRLDTGALLFVDGLPGVELHCAGPNPAVLTGLRRLTPTGRPPTAAGG